MRGSRDVRRCCICMCICWEGGSWCGLPADSDSLQPYKQLITKSDCKTLMISVEPSLTSEPPHTGGNSFVRRRHHQMATYLINYMGFEPAIANTLLHLHKPATLRDALDLFILNDDGLINHFFIPSNQNAPGICIVCEGVKDNHIEGDQLLVQERWSEEVEHSRAVSFEEEEEELDGMQKGTCQICYIEVVEEDMANIRGQLHNICLQCLEIYLKEEISNMRVQGLSCPHCNLALPNDYIQQLLDRPTYNKYRQFMRNLEIRKNPNLKWCPNSKCSVLVSTDAKKKKSKCPKCSTLICNRCSRQAHPKSSCEGAFSRDIKDWENAKDVQKCKKCAGLVQKISGCNHMTCSICNYNWCWLCGSQYSSTHFSSLNPFGCPGLQDRAKDDWIKCRIALLRIGLLFLIIIGGPLVLPLAMLGVGPVLTIQMLHDCLYPEGWLKKTGVFLLGSVIGLAADPLFWIGCIFYFLPKGVAHLYHRYTDRREEEERRESFLQQRLISEQIYESNT